MRVSPLREKHWPNSCNVHILQVLRILPPLNHIFRSSAAQFWKITPVFCVRREYCVLRGDADAILNTSEIHVCFARVCENGVNV